jgi:uncharacterized membrane protein SpoIIM required for sporulation
MTQEDFQRHHESDWVRLQAMLDALSSRKGRSQVDAAEFPRLYRRVCQHLAIARERQYATYVVDRLNDLVLRGHQQFYSAQAGLLSRMLHFVGAGFPRLVRAEWRLLLVAFALFYLPQLWMGWMTYHRPEMIYTVMDAAEVSQFESMYRPDAPHIGRERGADNDFVMFGVYIKNNISIGFQTFAGGMAFGLGSIFFLLFNGIFLGGVAGYLTQLGYGGTFWPFVIGHGAFEDTAIVLAGLSGLKLGFALIAPGQRTRLQALIGAARIAVRIVYGVVGMLVIAAFFEAFWSGSAWVPAQIKYAVGAALWCLVAAYFLLLGRQRAA